MATSFISRIALIGGGTFMVYKVLVPSESSFAPGISDKDDSPFKGKDASFARVMRMASEGYSYQAITKIISKEEKERYKELYERERQERLAAIAEEEKLQSRLIKMDEAIETAVAFVTGNL